ncbi:TPA: mini-MOMP protein [Campylobacter jejuni]|uniref:Mini-MOMP protein n=1 Tax=Campylobacter jejuni TaxID=197 RepID=A0A5T2D4R6_CAMJU|nr:mini-MOMP protein [Campylobacter jejuni]EAH4641327.1 mini-MOMP protein [Campylobacter jejuni]EAH4829045.1 mini-MOMP protein [Campylobacter jejuni]EAI0623948.1 mini-MOMP protein [Campylobacter jejuni]EAI1598375.1 mini-MOMP protein [Campylobacter jejuni]
MKKIFLIGMILNHFVFAAPLDEVFKDIEVSGTVRYRYDIKKEKKYNKKHIDIKIKHKQKLQ